MVSMINDKIARLLTISSFRQEIGQAAVEFALCSTILFGVTFGMVDFARAVYTASAVQAAAQEGARAGIVDVHGIEAVALERLLALDTERADVDYSFPDSNTVKVNIKYQFECITPLAVLMKVAGMETIELSAESSMVIK